MKDQTSRRRKHIKDATTVRGPKHSIWKKIGAAFGMAVSIFSLYVALYPHLNIYADKRLYPFDPMKTTFVIANQGILPIKNIIYQPKFDSLVAGNNTFRGFTAGSYDYVITELPPFKSSTITIDPMFWAPAKAITFAKLKITASFEISFLTFHDEFGFKV